MRSDDFIRSLIADLKPVRRLRSVNVRVAWWVSLALFCVAVGSYALGTRHDLAQRLHDPAYLAESAALLVLAVSSARRAFHLSIPGAERSPLARAVPIIGLLAWVFLIALRWSPGTIIPVSSPGGLRCVWRILGLAFAPSLPLFFMLRKAVPRERSWIGCLAVVSASALATLGTQMVCAKDDPGHVMLWHVGVVLLVGLVGVGAGRLVLRVDRSFQAARNRGRPASVER